jgi:hypothetical protein
MFKMKPLYAAFDLKQATITIQDGGAGSLANEIEVIIGEGELTFTERSPVEYIKNRGALDGMTSRYADEELLEVSLDFVWEYYTSKTGDTAPSISDALKGRGTASDWVSSDIEDACAPYAVNIVIEYVPDECEGGDNETITLPNFRVEQMTYSVSDAKVSCTGFCAVQYATAVKEAKGTS